MNFRYSVIIPAYNEERWLPQTLAFLRQSMDAVPFPGEVIVVDNHSTDRTAEVAESLGVRVVFEPVNQISRARNAGGRVATGDFLIFLDADTFLSRNLLQTALTDLSGGRCCGGGAAVDFYEPVPRLVRHGVGLWNRFSRSFGIAAGCFIYCVKRGFDEIDGFSEAVYASEEFWFSLKLKSWGKQRGLDFRVIRDLPIITSTRKLEWFSPMELFLILLIGTIPFAVRNRALCAFWYRRPSG